jgi:hypothetical protein
MGIRASGVEFAALNLRCHALLSDVPLHDVWAIPLDGGGAGRTIEDVRAILFRDRRPSTNLIVRGLFALRSALGRVFGWDDARHDRSDESYLHRLTESDRARSRVRPGTRDGSFRVLYVFDGEAVSEIRNATVHAFLALALEPRPSGYLLYLAVYVKPVSRLTPVYMAMIDPFRRWLVYPALAQQIQRAWRVRRSDRA